jgi:hypothetical protein
VGYFPSYARKTFSSKNSLNKTTSSEVGTRRGKNEETKKPPQNQGAQGKEKLTNCEKRN